MYRQGDVLLIPARLRRKFRLQEIPRENGRIVLAHGEATGHAHAIADPSALFFAEGDRRVLIVKKPVQLTHEEHAPIMLPGGTYEVRRQTEYQPAHPTQNRYVRD